MLNDHNYKSLIANGDQKKFGHLMELTSDELLWFAIGFLKNKEIAEEIVSDVYVNIWNNRAQLEKIINLKSYLFISVRNGCLSHLRKVKNEKIISIDTVNEFSFMPVEGPEDSLIEKEIIEQIYAAIETLPGKCKLAFTLAKINGLKYREIAEVLGVSEKTVNNHLVLAVKKITVLLNVNKKHKEKTSPLKRASIFVL
ncbi:MAG TPA: RNA polymerase sigma-70 factor [Draconibacterium sp.]|nr:RNA polymerase sigma-70 factor [Draconibacterium sp.]